MQADDSMKVYKQTLSDRYEEESESFLRLQRKDQTDTQTQVESLVQIKERIQLKRGELTKNQPTIAIKEKCKRRTNDLQDII